MQVSHKISLMMTFGTPLRQLRRSGVPGWPWCRHSGFFRIFFFFSGASFFFLLLSSALAEPTRCILGTCVWGGFHKTFHLPVVRQEMHFFLAFFLTFRITFYILAPPGLHPPWPPPADISSPKNSPGGLGL